MFVRNFGVEKKKMKDACINNLKSIKGKRKETKKYGRRINAENKKKTGFSNVRRAFDMNRASIKTNEIRRFSIRKMRTVFSFEKKKIFSKEFRFILCSVKQLLLNELFFVRV